jgi:hypothetical protein
MNKRKLQIFVSSTYEDLIDHRLAAMEAILAAGHIPAAMEQFSPGDETAWEKIQSWIDESDGFILILGGRYGSIEPLSGKSYVQLEYEYAVEKKKPFFALVVGKEHHEQRVKEIGFKADEREHPDKYVAFKKTVTERLTRFWNDKKDIQAAIFQKLPEWAQRSDLVGWIRANDVPGAEVTNELARLSQENRELRSQLSSQKGEFNGLTFDELINILRNDRVLEEERGLVTATTTYVGLAPRFPRDVEEVYFKNYYEEIRHQGDVFEILSLPLATQVLKRNNANEKLISYGLAEDEGNFEYMKLTDAGIRFRNRLLAIGDLEFRRKTFWAVESESG